MSLEDELKARIATSGPLTIAEYMADCLLHPTFGYYATRDPLGQSGDFITAPEISQMFGELVGLCLAQAWMDRGAPDRIVLAELGPGRGTLMADMLRATRRVPGFHDALEVHLVEASPVLRKRQTEAVPAAVTHHDTFDTVPEAPLFLVANEFFDALPIRQFLRDGPSWRERVIGLQDDALVLGLSDRTNPEALTDRLTDTTEGDIVELCPSAAPLAADIGRRITEHGGVGLIVDYGDWRSLGDTLQAVKGHEAADLLGTPGSADLTAHVDFEVIAQACAPAITTRLTPQGIFLERLGITQRAQALAQSLKGDALETHIAAHRRLTHPDEMGTLFKAIAIIEKDSPLLPALLHDP